MKLKSLAIIPFLFGAPVMADDHAANLDSDKQKLSYVFGINAGQNLKAEGIDLDIDAFSAAVADVFSGKQPQLDQAIAEKVITEFQQKKAQEMAAVMNQKQEQSTAYMEDNAKQDGVVTTASGLQYKILTEGDGAVPTEKDKVIAHYKGTLVDGTIFDSSYDRGEPATFGVTGVIKGWQEVLQLMKEGAKWQIVVPSDLAYGPRGAGPNSPIGPNETLLFDIELIAITQ